MIDNDNAHIVIYIPYYSKVRKHQGLFAEFFSEFDIAIRDTKILKLVRLNEESD